MGCDYTILGSLYTRKKKNLSKARTKLKRTNSSKST